MSFDVEVQEVVTVRYATIYRRQDIETKARRSSTLSREFFTRSGYINDWSGEKRISARGHHGKMLFMESTSVREHAATWKAGSGGALERYIKITVS